MLLTAQLENETDRQFEFELVIKEGDPNPQTRRPHLLCPLKPLPPFETQTLKLSRVQEICKEEGPNWWIRVKYGDEFNFIYLHATDHLLRSTRIIFKCRPNGLFVPFVKAIEESGDHTTFIADFLLHLNVDQISRELQPVLGFPKSSPHMSTTPPKLEWKRQKLKIQSVVPSTIHAPTC